MKKTIAAVALGLISSGFCVDEYMPVEAGKLEIDVGYSFMMTTDSYDGDGDKEDDSGFTNFLPLQLKYGIMPGLDVELAWTGLKSNKDAGDYGGFMRPELAVKYGMADIGAGAFVNLVLPFVTGNLDQPDPVDPAMGLGFGAVYGNRFGDFRATALASYMINFENGDNYKAGNLLTIYLKPEAMWTEFIGTYLGIKFEMTGEPEVDGKSLPGTVDLDANLLTLAPGLNCQLLPNLAYEVNVPVTVMGKNSTAGWGVWASVYYTLGL